MRELRYCKKCGVRIYRLGSHARLCTECQRPINRKAHLRHKYGISPEDYDAMVLAQGGACAACDRTDQKLVVDHDHATGELRQLLCDRCNRILGFAKDDIHVLGRLVIYLQIHGEWKNTDAA
jgi:hypothetical protein